MTDQERFDKLILNCIKIVDVLIGEGIAEDRYLIDIQNELLRLKSPAKWEYPKQELPSCIHGIVYNCPHCDKPKQCKFGIDDLINVYHRDNNILRIIHGKVVHIDLRDKTLYVIDRQGNDRGWFHIKQCRKLKKKRN